MCKISYKKNRKIKIKKIKIELPPKILYITTYIHYIGIIKYSKLLTLINIMVL